VRAPFRHVAEARRHDVLHAGLLQFAGRHPVSFPASGRRAVSIIYIHGVKVRDPRHGAELERPFRRWLPPNLTVNGTAVEYLPVFWGDAAAKFRWGLASRPKTALLKQGGDGNFAGLGSLREAGPNSPLDNPVTLVVGSGPVIGRAGVASKTSTPPLSSVPPGQRADLLADLFLAVRPKGATRASGATRDPLAEDPDIAAVADAAASVAENWDSLTSKEATDDARAARLMQAIEASLLGEKLLQQGGFRAWMSKAGETLGRAAHWPPDAVSTVFAELRPVANEFVAYFIGDVLAYLNNRGSDERSPGEIPLRVIEALRKAHSLKRSTGERIIVVTHSMGGQLFYDATTFFAPADSELADLKVDHWISCGSQVSFFAELGLFNGQPATKAPDKLNRPASVSAWTNYYDRNDLAGFVMKPVFEGVEDIQYDTGYGLAFAHSGFFARPSFFEAIAKRIKQ